MEELLSEISGNEELTREELLEWISIFQHERLIHLLVTLFFSGMGIAALIAGVALENLLFLVLFLIILVLDIFYIRHYYILENGIQRLYRRLM